MGSPFLVSVHIPMTGGGMLATVLDACFERRVIYDYDGYDNPILPNVLIKTHSLFVSQYFEVIHGHFFAQKYSAVFPGASFVTMLRHPVERVIAHFYYEKNNKSESWYSEDIATGRMDIVEFAAQSGVGNAMSVHLSGMDLKDYALLLIAERFQASLHMFSLGVKPLHLERYFGSPPNFSFVNVADSLDVKQQMSDDVRRKIYEKTAPDNEIYAQGLELFEQKSKLLLV